MQKNPKLIVSRKVIRFDMFEKECDISRQKRVLVGGCFDLLHVGHVRFLRSSKKRGDNLIIALESDDFIRMKKKREPVYPQRERAEILAELSCVNSIILLPFFQSDKEYMSLVKTICPAVIAVTHDDPYLTHKKEQAVAVGGEVIVVLNRISLHSTNVVLHRIIEVQKQIRH
ncbi:MAG TPA: adenylyltransferase/cytidyltransferase family protein [Patescibacteria group bacterium]|nr:adenylyltransferase/cytidyltransferase family protein [Patescibacteria group bacterium]